MGEVWIDRTWLGWFRSRELAGVHCTRTVFAQTSLEVQGEAGKQKMDLQMWNWNGEGKSQGPRYRNLVWRWGRARGFEGVSWSGGMLREVMGGGFWSEWRKEGHHALAGLQYMLSGTHLCLQAVERFLCGSAVWKISIYLVCLHD